MDIVLFNCSKHPRCLTLEGYSSFTGTPGISAMFSEGIKKINKSFILLFFRSPNSGIFKVGAHVQQKTSILNLPRKTRYWVQQTKTTERGKDVTRTRCLALIYLLIQPFVHLSFHSSILSSIRLSIHPPFLSLILSRHWPDEEECICRQRAVQHGLKEEIFLQFVPGFLQVSG